MIEGRYCWNTRSVYQMCAFICAMFFVLMAARGKSYVIQPSNHANHISILYFQNLYIFAIYGWHGWITLYATPIYIHIYPRIVCKGYIWGVGRVKKPSNHGWIMVGKVGRFCPKTAENRLFRAKMRLIASHPPSHHAANLGRPDGRFRRAAPLSSLFNATSHQSGGIPKMAGADGCRTHRRLLCVAGHSF